jgi:predicted acylesterase/phospholipase RssA
MQLDKIRYLSFEGRGGTALLYKDIIEVLEQQYALFYDRQGKAKVESSMPLFSPIPNYIKNPLAKQLRGVAGSSTGALFAYMMAIGMRSSDMGMEMNQATGMSVRDFFLPFGIRKKMKISEYEAFFEEANYRTFFNVRNNSRSIDTMETSSFWKTLINETGVTNLVDEQIINAVATLFPYFFYNLVASSSSEIENAAAYIASFRNEKNPLLLYKRLIGYDKMAGGPLYPFGIDFLKKLVDTASTRDMLSFIDDMGIFTGEALRDYIVSLMRRYLFPVLEQNKVCDTNSINAETLSFKEFFKLTGVDLIVTATNVTVKKPALFSYFFTPDFPVIEAVAISMAMPGLYKPVKISYDVMGTNDFITRFAYRAPTLSNTGGGDSKKNDGPKPVIALDGPGGGFVPLEGSKPLTQPSDDAPGGLIAGVGLTPDASAEMVEEYCNFYKGYFCDGGLLLRQPLNVFHSFCTLPAERAISNGKPAVTMNFPFGSFGGKIYKSPNSAGRNSNSELILSVSFNSDLEKQKRIASAADGSMFYHTFPLGLSDFLGDCSRAFGYSSAYGQLLDPTDEAYNIKINIDGYDTADWATPFVHSLRGEKALEDAQVKRSEAVRKTVSSYFGR